MGEVQARCRPGASKYFIWWGDAEEATWDFVHPEPIRPHGPVELELELDEEPIRLNLS